MSTFAVQDVYAAHRVQRYHSMEDFSGGLRETDEDLAVLDMYLYHEQTVDKHEYLVFRICSPSLAGPPVGRLDIRNASDESDNSKVYYLRLERRFAVEGGMARQLAVASSLVTTANTVAIDDISLTKQLSDNERFRRGDDVLRCRATFSASGGPQLRHILRLVRQIRQLSDIQGHTLFLPKTWAFTRLIFCKLSQHTWLHQTKVDIVEKDGSMVTGDLDAFLAERMGSFDVPGIATAIARTAAAPAAIGMGALLGLAGAGSVGVALAGWGLAALGGLTRSEGGSPIPWRDALAKLDLGE